MQYVLNVIFSRSTRFNKSDAYTRVTCLLQSTNVHVPYNPDDSQVINFSLHLMPPIFTMCLLSYSSRSSHFGSRYYCFLLVSISYYRSLVSLLLIILSTLTISPLPPSLFSTFSFRCLKSISMSKFMRDSTNSQLITHPPTDLCDFVDAYNTTLFSLNDKYAPFKTKTNRAKSPNPWFTPALAKL